MDCCYKEQPEKTLDDVVLPGFRFHPTDEELVAFYLRRKIQHKSLPIELIHQVDIYKYDPWDLPKLATSGEKEWYFYCPRDRKYRNSSRPNRVTGAGFWKATGTDRPIYASDHGTKCIGLKKSLVFYQGRAAKGIKTDWMMHEFRLPSVSDPIPPAKKFSEKTIPASECWAICRIFKKTTSMAQRALSQSWAGQLHEVHNPNMFGQVTELAQTNPGIFSSETPPIQFISGDDTQFIKSISSRVEIPSYKSIDQPISPTPRPSLPSRDNTPVNFMLSPPAASMFQNMPLHLYNNEYSKGSEMKDFAASIDQFNDFTISFSQDVQEHTTGYEGESIRKNPDYNQIGTIQGVEFPFSLFPTNTLEVCEEPRLRWDSSLPSTGDMSITYSAAKS